MGSASSAAPGPARGGAPIRLVAVDLDGVVWLAGAVLPEAAPALNEVVRRGLDLRYVSNNSTTHREAVSERLAAAGLPAGADRVLTSGYVTGQWLRQRLPEGAPVLVVGEAGLMRELTEAGLRPVHAGEPVSPAAPAAPPSATPPEAPLAPPAAPAAEPSAGGEAPAAAPPAPASPPTGAAGSTPFQAVVVGMDRSFTYKGLAQAQAAILGGALFVGTNPDATFPTPAGLLPGAGSVVAAVATAAQREPVFMGKPALGLAEILAKVTGIPPAETLLIGDRLSTDIGMGRRAGMVTALVLTGVTSRAELAESQAAGSPDLPDHLLNTLADLPPLLESLGL